MQKNQLIQVAERRYRDALALTQTGKNERAMGAKYLGGFVIEILLKANLVERFPEASRKTLHADATRAERAVWTLVWRLHALGAMIDNLPELEAALLVRGDRDGRRYVEDLKAIATAWHVQLRYSTESSTIRQATDFLEKVRILKEVLK